MLKPQYMGTTIASCPGDEEYLFECFSDHARRLIEQKNNSAIWQEKPCERILNKLKELEEEWEEAGEEDKGYIIFEEYPDLFQRLAPTLTFFGCNEGDSSWGYWLIDMEFSQIEEIPEEYMEFLQYKEINEENLNLVKLVIWQEEIKKKIAEGEKVVLCEDHTGQYFFQYDPLMKIYEKIY